MQATRKTRDDPWLPIPLRSEIGTIRLAGTLKDIPGINRHSMRILGSFALIYMVDGNGYYSDANGSSKSLVPGDAIVVFPDLAHAYGPTEKNAWTQIYVVFEGPQFELMSRAGILDSTDPIWHLEPRDYWARRLEDLLASNKRYNSSDGLRILGRFTHLLTDMAASTAKAASSNDETWLEESLQQLSEPINGIWLPPQTVAQRVGLSYENFRKLFVNRIGEAPGKFQTKRKIERACAAIYQEATPFKQLADELGFCDVYHFSRVFRQIAGEPPSAYRKRVRGG